MNEVGLGRVKKLGHGAVTIMSQMTLQGTVKPMVHWTYLSCGMGAEPSYSFVIKSLNVVFPGRGSELGQGSFLQQKQLPKRAGD